MNKTVYVIKSGLSYWSDYGDGWTGDKSNAREWRERLSAESFARNLDGDTEVVESCYPVYPGLDYLKNWSNDNKTILSIVNNVYYLMLGDISPEEFEEFIGKVSQKLAYYK